MLFSGATFTFGRLAASAIASASFLSVFMALPEGGNRQRWNDLYFVAMFDRTPSPIMGRCTGFKSYHPRFLFCKNSANLARDSSLFGKLLINGDTTDT